MQTASEVQATTQWLEVGSLDEIPRGSARTVQTAGGDIAIFRAMDDQVFAIADKCPHRGGPLSHGMLYGHTVACPLHNWNIDLKTGHAVAPDEGCAETYGVRVQEGLVYLALKHGERPD